MPEPFYRKVIERDSAYSGTWQETFRLDGPLPRFHVQTYGKGDVSKVTFDFDGEGGVWMLRNFPMQSGYGRFQCGRDVPAGVYTVRAKENGFRGRYVIEVGTRHGTTWWQRLLIIMVSIFVLSGMLYAVQKLMSAYGKKVPVLAIGRYVFIITSASLFVIFLYLLFHEGGHALASICFGNFDFSRSDFFGLGGQPHSGTNPGVDLEPWQKAIQSIAGPLVPSLAAYILFFIWRMRWAKRIRERIFLVDLYWSFGLFVLLFAHTGALMPILGFKADGDYSGFINNIPFERWQGNAFLVLVLVVNVCMLAFVVPRLWGLKKKIKSDAIGSRG